MVHGQLCTWGATKTHLFPASGSEPKHVDTHTLGGQQGIAHTASGQLNTLLTLGIVNRAALVLKHLARLDAFYKPCAAAARLKALHMRAYDLS